jgi:hypothetical protein
LNSPNNSLDFTQLGTNRTENIVTQLLHALLLAQPSAQKTSLSSQSIGM